MGHGISCVLLCDGIWVSYRNYRSWHWTLFIAVYICLCPLIAVWLRTGRHSFFNCTINWKCHVTSRSADGLLPLWNRTVTCQFYKSMNAYIVLCIFYRAFYLIKYILKLLFSGRRNGSKIYPLGIFLSKRLLFIETELFKLNLEIRSTANYIYLTET